MFRESQIWKATSIRSLRSRMCQGRFR
ncbi:DUF2183 superfamily domain-containing protein [Histoplasma capsulatum G186AR]|uniref:DUF2183 superfamily domain-containing protein n=1 Tax=Ajellomyces capsulatus TaxID=5037 RepID=A0A8H8D6S2_AJECA|nr:DUF2183 superfamily domain-containing protein [Histoplasma capsulatum]QSS69653.1 DUF2183 superfamily domain-containing protein [Histoplasma capsulatum G186AR]